MKKYFQNIYNETGEKPFTFLNCLLSVLLPLTVFIIVGSSTGDEAYVLTVSLIVSLICWGIDILLLFKKFKNAGRVFILFALGLLASIAFFCKLILFPLIAFLFRMSGSATAVQMGDFSSASNTANRATSKLGNAKMSAFNWFVYDDRKFTDININNEPDETFVSNNQAWNGELQRNFTREEDLKAKQMGYTDAKNAYDSGVGLDKITK